MKSILMVHFLTLLSPSTPVFSRQSSRDSELFTLRYKEVCLRAQFAMMELETPNQPAVRSSRPLENKPVASMTVKNSRPLESPVASPKKKMKLRPRQVEKLRPVPVEKKPVKPLQPVPKAELASSSKKLILR